MMELNLLSRIMILRLTWMLLLGVAVLPKFSSNPISDDGNKEGTVIVKDERFDDSAENVTEPMYEKEDIVRTIATEFLFLAAGDHLFLPEPSDLEEDLELHRNAQILAGLLTRLNCTRQVYNLLNETAREVDVSSWSEPSRERHLLTEIFDKVVEEMKCVPDVYAEYLREGRRLKDDEGSVELAHIRENRVTSSEKKTFYDMTSIELSAIEDLFDSQLIKKVVLTIELLQQTEESLDEAPEAAQLYRKRLETAKAAFKLAESKDIETRLRIQKVFDEALNDAVEHFEGTMFRDQPRRILCDSLSKKIEDDEVLRKEFNRIKPTLYHINDLRE